MTVTAIPAMSQTSDGREFELEAEAKRWEEILGAQEDYKDARKRFLRLMQRNMVTADGVLFKDMNPYWRIREWHGAMARLEEVRIYEQEIELHEWDGMATERVQIRLPLKDHHGHPTREFFVVDISDFYRSHEKAEAALLKVNRRILAEWQEDLAHEPT